LWHRRHHFFVSIKMMLAGRILSAVMNTTYRSYWCRNIFTYLLFSDYAFYIIIYDFFKLHFLNNNIMWTPIITWCLIIFTFFFRLWEFILKFWQRRGSGIKTLSGSLWPLLNNFSFCYYKSLKDIALLFNIMFKYYLYLIFIKFSFHVASTMFVCKILSKKNF
jgi:hypothetical protein